MVESKRTINKTKLFIENFLVYGIGGVIGKFIPLIMVPIITRLMPNSEYFGISDMSNTIISFGSALAVMGMYDAMYRMFFEKEDENYKKMVCSTTVYYTGAMSFLVFFALIIFREHFAKWFLKDNTLSFVIVLSAMATMVTATNSIISAPTRMQNKRKIYLIINTISPLLAYGISVPLLLAGYYTTALPIAGVVSGLSVEISFWAVNKKWFSPSSFDKKLLRQLLKIAIPLLPNFLIYWVFNSSDRIMIASIMDIGAEGIYSVGAKLGHASQLIYTAFAGGWQYFAFSTMHEEDQVRSNSKVFEYLGVISFISTAFICAFSYFIYSMLFFGEYVNGYIVSPYLFLAPLLQMLFQVACNQFLVIKKTWPNMFILLAGAIINIILNLVLIPIIGIEGAAIATLIGYAVSDIVAVIVLCNMKLMIISGRFVFVSICMVLFFVVWRLINPCSLWLGLIYLAMFIAICCILYKKELIVIINKIKK